MLIPCLAARQKPLCGQRVKTAEAFHNRLGAMAPPCASQDKNLQIIVDLDIAITIGVVTKININRDIVGCNGPDWFCRIVAGRSHNRDRVRVDPRDRGREPRDPPRLVRPRRRRSGTPRARRNLSHRRRTPRRPRLASPARAPDGRRAGRHQFCYRLKVNVIKTHPLY